MLLSDPAMESGASGDDSVAHMRRGKALVNLLQLKPEEKVRTAVRVDGEFDSERYFLFSTKMGRVKRTELAQFTNIRANGLIAINLNEGDELVGVRLTHAGQHAILAVRSGKSIRFPVEDARAMGRSAAGVKDFYPKTPGIASPSGKTKCGRRCRS